MIDFYDVSEMQKSFRFEKWGTSCLGFFFEGGGGGGGVK